MSEVGAEVRLAGTHTVVVTGGDGLHRSKGGYRGRQVQVQGWVQDRTGPARGRERGREGGGVMKWVIQEEGLKTKGIL